MVILKVTILQPHVPHYREQFFYEFGNLNVLDIYCYEDENNGSLKNFKKSNVNSKFVRNFKFGQFLFYNPIKFLNKKNDILILMLHFGHITTWLLLLTKFVHKKKIILWGQGISVKRYLKQEKKPSVLLKLMIYFADSVWLYTKKEQDLWSAVFPKKQIVALNNTISNVENILNFRHPSSCSDLKNKYRITQDICFIFCARFDNPYRRIDLLLKIINRLDSKKFGFIIIGQGIYKPDFSNFNNVHDFGSVYDIEKKNDLFTIADLYIQPGWVGLSVVEAMAYGKPILTFVRSEETLQCVEYSYLLHKNNSLIFESLDDCCTKLEKITKEDINKMGDNARAFVKNNLTMKNMVNLASNSFN